MVLLCACVQGIMHMQVQCWGMTVYISKIQSFTIITNMFLLLIFYLLLNAFNSLTGDYSLIKNTILFFIDLSLIVREIETKRDNK